MKRMSMLVAALMASVMLQAQTFDNIINWSSPTYGASYSNQVTVITPSTGDYYYHLTRDLGNAAVLTKFYPNGSVYWSRELHIPGAISQEYYSICFDNSETIIAVVGMANFGSSDNRIAVMTITTNFGIPLNAMTYSAGSTGWVEGVSIKPYNSTGEFLIAGNYRVCHPFCNRMFLARVNQTSLALNGAGYLFDVSNKEYETFNDMLIVDDEVTLMGLRGNIEVILAHISLAGGGASLNYNYGGANNVMSLLYPHVIEQAPHFIADGSTGTPPVYIGAGISSTNSTNVLLTKLNYTNFSTVWSNHFVHSGGSETHSPGRLITRSTELVTSFHAYSADDGILVVDKNTGAQIIAWNYPGWSNAALFDVNSVSGSETFMTDGWSGGMRYFDGDALGTSLFSCGVGTGNFDVDPQIPDAVPYEYTIIPFLTAISEPITGSVLSGSYSDCAATTSSSFKRDLASSVDGPEVQLHAVYPNPTNGTTRIELGSEVDEVLVTDVHGKVLVTVNDPSEQFDLDLSAYPNGVYFLRFKDEHASSTMKLNKL